MIENAADHAYHALGIQRQRLNELPQITPQLRTIQKTMRGDTHMPYGPGSDLLISWPDYLSASDDPEAIRVRNTYYSLPQYLRRKVPIEGFCLAAGVSPLRILELLIAAVIRAGAAASNVIAAVNQPRIVQKTVEMALTDDGHKDREVLHKHAGFLPTPRGPSTSIVVQQTATANAAAVTVPVPPPEQTIRRLADRFNLARALPEQVSTPMPRLDGLQAAMEVPAYENMAISRETKIEAEIDDDVREE